MTRALGIIVNVVLIVVSLNRVSSRPRLSASTTSGKLRADPRPPAVSLDGAAEYSPGPFNQITTVWGHDGNDKGVTRVEDEVLARVGILQILRDHIADGGCQRAVDAVLEARRQLQHWALKMDSSSAALPDAIVQASLYSLGDFEGCLSASDHAAYCLVDAELSPPGRPMSAEASLAHVGDELSPYCPPGGPNATLWDLLQTSGNRRRYRRDLQLWGVCLPAACAPRGAPGEDPRDPELGPALAAALQGLARPLGLRIGLHLDPTDCSFADQRRPTEDNDFFLALQERPVFLVGSLAILSFPTLVLVATFFARCRQQRSADDAPGKPGAVSKTLDCFSLQRNWAKLVRKQMSQIHCLQGLRTFTIATIVFGHRNMFLSGGLVRNPEFVEDSYTRALKMIIVNGNMVVCTFFVISGFLEARTSMSQVGKMRCLSPFLVMYHLLIRYLRLLPTLAVVLGVEMLWVNMMGDGPVWNRVVGKAVQDCRSSWWSHLLFVNNYTNPESHCLLQTWFVAALLQMFVPTLPVMWLVSRWTLRSLWPGFVLLGLLLVAAIVSLYVSTVALDLHPVVHPYPQLLRGFNILTDATFTKQYVAAHTNAVPYVVGLMAGTLLHLADGREWRPSKRQQSLLFLGMLASTLLGIVFMLSGIFFFLPTFQSRPLLDAMYGPARSLAGSLYVAWTIFACGIGSGGFVDQMLSTKPMCVLGRLTFAVYLVHVTVIEVSSGYIRQPEELSNYLVLTHTTVDLVVSFFLGLLLHLCVEAPMANLLGMVVSSRGGPEPGRSMPPREEAPASRRDPNPRASEPGPSELRH